LPSFKQYFKFGPNTAQYHIKKAAPIKVAANFLKPFLMSKLIKLARIPNKPAGIFPDRFIFCPKSAGFSAARWIHLNVQPDKVNDTNGFRK
jgi:hypothetical protein